MLVAPGCPLRPRSLPLYGRRQVSRDTLRPRSPGGPDRDQPDAAGPVRPDSTQPLDDVGLPDRLLALGRLGPLADATASCRETSRRGTPPSRGFDSRHTAQCKLTCEKARHFRPLEVFSSLPPVSWWIHVLNSRKGAVPSLRTPRSRPTGAPLFDPDLLKPEPASFPGDRSSEPPPSREGSHSGLPALPPDKHVAGRRGHCGGQEAQLCAGRRLQCGRRLPSLWALRAPGLTSGRTVLSLSEQGMT